MSDEQASEPGNDTLSLTTEIVSAYVSHHHLAAAELPMLITSVRTSLSNLGQPEVLVSEKPQPAVPVRKSIAPEYLVCLEDGRKVKMLKRYLQTRYNLTPAAYRQKWGLPSDYPMVAPAYAERRSALAKEIGLGRKRASPPAPAPALELEPAPEPAKRRVGGRRKTA